MPKLDHILDLVQDLTQDQTEQLVSELFQILDEPHFERIRTKFFSADEDPRSYKDPDFKDD